MKKPLFNEWDRMILKNKLRTYDLLLSRIAVAKFKRTIQKEFINPIVNFLSKCLNNKI
jgi:hypothetical protein